MPVIQPQDLVVEIFVPEAGTGGKEGRIATGYPVARDRILTARHALFPKGPRRDLERPVEVRFRCPGVEPIWRPLDAEPLCWDSLRWDLALLVCELPPGVQPWWGGFLSAQRPEPSADWYGAGFPRIGGKRDGERKAFGMGGSVKAALATADAFQVEETAGPKDADAWKGASGAPVFIGGRLVGVVVSVPEDLEARRLNVAPLWRVLAEEAGFCEQIRYRQRLKRRDDLADRVRAALVAAPAAATALGAAIPGLADAIAALPPGQHPAKVCAALLDLEIDAAVAIVEGAHRGLVRSDPLAARAIAEVARALVPAVYDYGVCEAVRCACTDAKAGLLAVPAYHPTVAEVIMAGADGRPVDLFPRCRPSDFPKGRLSLSEPPECGPDDDGAMAIAAVEAHLVQKLGFGQDSGSARTPELSRRLAARELAYQADHQRTHYLLLRPPRDAADGERSQRLALGLRELFGRLVCLALSDDDGLAVAEFDRFRPFLDLLPLEIEPGP
ncbi:MAG: hypothetical protein MUF66_04580 [Gammaproteobacteria bacterium]|jgi:hypothetical protein|nr:hypothetical protein [Gammaproteobacteria bacterium]